MIIDLSEWSEYIADDVAPGPIPAEAELELMQITTFTGLKKKSVDGLPGGVIPDLCTIRNRFFWRIEK